MIAALLGLALLAASAAPDTAAGLGERLRVLSATAGGSVGIAVTHIEAGETIAVAGEQPLPMFSVFKLPLAVAVLREIEEGKLTLEKKVQVSPADERSIRDLLEVSIVLSDNPSTDALLALIGGPEALTGRMRALGFTGIEVRSAVRDFARHGAHPNTASPRELVRLLTRLQNGELLAPAHRELLLGFMSRSKTGSNRLRGDLPQGTQVADKTGTGETATNDVGIISLPAEGGHLAMAVLISGSKLSLAEQEKLIADLARVAFDHYANGPTGPAPAAPADVRPPPRSAS